MNLSKLTAISLCLGECDNGITIRGNDKIKQGVGRTCKWCKGTGLDIAPCWNCPGQGHCRNIEIPARCVTVVPRTGKRMDQIEYRYYPYTKQGDKDYAKMQRSKKMKIIEVEENRPYIQHCQKFQRYIEHGTLEETADAWRAKEYERYRKERAA